MSRRIKSLEDSLETALVIREGRGMTLTPAARELADSVREPLSRLTRALEQVRGRGDEDTGVVRFGFPFTLPAALIPQMLRAFRANNPRVDLVLRQAHGSALVDGLRSGGLDLAVVIPPPDGIPHELIGAQRILLVVGIDHHLAHRSSVAVSELEGESFVAPPADFHLRALVERFCVEAGFSPDVAVEVGELSSLRELVAHGLGVALLPEGDPHPGTVEIKLDAGSYERGVALAWPNGVMTPAASRLRSSIRERASQARPSPVKLLQAT